MTGITLVSLVIPVHNEASNILPLTGRLTATLSSMTVDYEIIFVNDGSSDDTLTKIKQVAAGNRSIRYISFSRNFGHQVAIMAGISNCKGDVIITMDGDLQDPPELIPELFKRYTEGYKVVYAQRRSRNGENVLKKATASLFYRLLSKITNIHIPIDTGDFRLMDKKVAEYLLQMPEQNKFLRGQIAWIGFKQTAVIFDREGRHSGKTKFSYGKMIRFAFDGVTGFSNFPLRIASFLGFFVSIIAFIIILYALYAKYILHMVIGGWTSLIISSMFIGGIQLLSIGIIGEYISRINSDVRKRPLYIIEEDNLDT